MQGRAAAVIGIVFAGAIGLTLSPPKGAAETLSRVWASGQGMAHSLLQSIDTDPGMLQRLLEHMAAQVRRNLPIKGADGTTLVSVVADPTSIRATYEVPPEVAEAFREPGKSKDYLAAMYRTQCSRNTFDAELKMGGTVYMDYMEGPRKVTAMVFRKETCADGIFPPKDQGDLFDVGPK